MEIPLGQRESSVLEFKSREELKERKNLGKEIVAFLNTQGGDLYIGIREENEIAVAIEPIEDAENAALDLTNSLISRIEPTFAPGEVHVEVVSDKSGLDVIRIHVKRGDFGPYALVKTKEAHRFFVRIGPRLREMTRRELAARFTEGSLGEDAVETTRHSLLLERDEIQAEAKDQVWCAIQPVAEIDLNTGDPELARLLSDREAIGTPADAPSFHVPFEPEVRQDRLTVRIRPPGEDPSEWAGLKETTLRRDGGIRFRAVLHLLTHHATGNTSEVINPETLIGLPLSLLRLAGVAFEDHLDENDRVVVDLALFGVGSEEYALFPSRWGLPRLPKEAHFYEDGDDLTLTQPPVFTFGEIRESPERCTYRLMSLIYEAFGLREDAIPMEFDPRTGRPRVPA